MIDPDRVKVYVTTTATFTAIVFIVLTSILPEYAVMWLSIEVILLPAIYIIGSTTVERLIREEYDAGLQEVIERSNDLNEKYNKLRSQYNKIKVKKWRKKL